MKKRFASACAIIALLFAATFAVDEALRGFPHASQNEQVFFEGGPSGERGVPEDMAASASSKGEGAAEKARLPLSMDAIAEERGFGRALSAEFVREAFDATGFDEVLVTSDEAIIGLIGSGSALETFSRLAAVLNAKGWGQVESGQSGIGTFAKTGGAYAWLMLACFDAGGLVSVVVQVR